MPKGIYKHRSGWHHSEKTKQKISFSKLGNQDGFKKGLIPWNKGLKTGIVSKTVFKKGHIVPQEWRRKISKNRKGIKHSEEAKRKMSKSHIGIQAKEKHPNWKGGITPENIKIRHSEEYKLWRDAVYKRDNYFCQICGIKCHNKNIVAHHIFPFIEYPHLRFAVNNGIVLCRKCHTRLHKPRLEEVKNGT